MIEIFDKQDGVRKIRRGYEDYIPLGSQETEQTAEQTAVKLTLEITDQSSGNKIRRTYEDNLHVETQEPQQPTEPTEPTETQPTTETGEEIAIADTSEPNEA